MYKFIVRRLLLGAITLFVATTIMFLFMRSLPGSPVSRLVGYENYNEDTAQYYTQKFGLDKPIMGQLFLYYQNLLKGDWGYSYVNNKPVWDVISSKIAPTVLIAIPSAVISFLLGTYFALKSERTPRVFVKVLDECANIISSVPSYIVALLALYFLSYRLKLFPSIGTHSSKNLLNGAWYLLDVIYHSILPIFSICIIDTAYYFKVMRTSIANERKSDYVCFLRNNGVSEKTIIYKYMAKNSIIPAINILSMSMTRVVTGALYVEIIFAWPGLGRQMYQSIMDRDYMVLSACFFLITVVVVVFMLFVDMFHLLIDPRLKG